MTTIKGKAKASAIVWSITFAITIVVLVSKLPTLTHFQVALFRALLAVTAANAAATLPSFLPIHMSRSSRAAIGLAVLFVVFFFNPMLPIVQLGTGG